MSGNNAGGQEGMLTFGGHLDVLRGMLLRIVIVIILLAGVIFCFKNETFEILLAPADCDFITFRLIGRMLEGMGLGLRLPEYHIRLISTELSAQFMTHVTVSCVLAALLASPYIMFEMFRFISPALYESEKRYSILVMGVIFFLFVLGLLMSYFVLFPVSFQFLATYQVDEHIESAITLSSYISTFITLTFLMGIVFQLPVIAFVMGKMGFVDAELLRSYRPHAFLVIMVIAAIITPPDLFTLVLVTVPIYALYELSILILRKWACGSACQEQTSA